MSYIDPNLSQKIGAEFKGLNVTQKKIVLNHLGSSERKALVQSLLSAHGKKLQQVYSQSIDKQIQAVRSLKPRITRITDLRIHIPSFLKKIAQFFHEILYTFSYLSASKAYDLIRQELLKQPPSIAKKPLTKGVLKNLIKQLKPGESLSALLNKHNYSTTIENASFAVTKLFRGLNLEGVSFKNCHFDRTHFSESSLKKVSFLFCTFSNVAFLSAQMEDVIFQDCEMQECMLNDASLKTSNFINSDLKGCSFENAEFNTVNFTQSSLTGTHFFQAVVNNSSMYECNLTDAIFFSTKEAFKIDVPSLETAKVTRPVCALLVHPEERGISLPKASMKLEQNAGSIPLRIAFQSATLKKEDVNLETEELFKALGSDDSSQVPIGQRLLQTVKLHPEAYPHIALILEKVRLLRKDVDSFFLPGGEDIPPALYGEVAEAGTSWGGDYRRSLTELAVVDQAFHRGIPIMAVCRGFQMANVYFGAHLKQDVAGQKGVQEFKLEARPYQGLYGAAMKTSVFSVAMHHQAVSLDAYGAARELEPAVIYQNLIKAAERKATGAAPMILLQFHPEFYKAATADSWTQAYFHHGLSGFMSDSNDAFWKILQDSAQAYHHKKIALQEMRLPKKLKPVEKKEEDR